MALDEIRRMIREALGIMPTLDLHGLGVKAALRETEQFLAEAQEECLGSVRIVYGKGKRSPGVGASCARSSPPGSTARVTASCAVGNAVRTPPAPTAA